jgi:cell division septation protein DedD
MVDNEETVRIIFSLILGLGLVSCEQRGATKATNSTSYRIVGKNGKAIYIEKKVPKLNEGYIARKEAQKKENSQLPALSSKKSTDLETRKSTLHPDLAASNAYSLRSVMDGTAGYDSNLESAAEDLSRVKNSKTITDFDYLPRNYFSDDRTSRESPSADRAKDVESSNGAAKPQPKPSPKAPRPEPGGRLYYVQLGLFVDRSNAEKLVEKFEFLVPDLEIRRGKTSKGKESYRVRGGGFASRAEMDRTVEQLRKHGHTDIYTFRE